MCMKTHKIYKPKGLTKKEQECLAAQERREMLIAFIMVVLGAVIVTIIFKLMVGTIDAV